MSVGTQRTSAQKPDLAETPPGLVDPLTAEAIEQWLTDGCRKPGRILIEVAAREDGFGNSWRVWIREEAAIWVEMWRSLVQGLGCRYGLAINATHRDIFMGMVNPPPGMAPKSIHKTGLAIDLGVVGTAGKAVVGGHIQDYAYPVVDWPTRYEVSWVPSRIDRRVLKALEASENQLKAADKALEKIDKQIGKNDGLINAEFEKILKQEARRSATKESIAYIKNLLTRPHRVGEIRALDQQFLIEDEKKLEEANAKIASLAERQRELEEVGERLRALRTELEVTEEMREDQKAELDRKVIAAKHGYRLQWRLYGHSELKVFAAARAGAPVAASFAAELKKAAAKANEIFEKSTKGCLGGIDVVEKEDYLKKRYRYMKLVCDDLAAEPETTAKKYFRATIRPFHYRPYEADGGSSGASLPAHRDRQPIPYLNAALNGTEANRYRGKPKTWLNITALGHHVGMFRIGANRTGFRDPRHDRPDGKYKSFGLLPTGAVDNRINFGAIVGLIERVWDPDSSYAEHKVIVRREPSRIRWIDFSQNRTAGADMADMTPLASRESGVGRNPGHYDLDFMRNWARIIGNKKTNIYWQATLPRLPWLTLYMPYGTKEEGNRWTWFKQAEDALRGDFSDKHFLVAYAGDHTGMNEREDDPQYYLDFCTLKTGAEWAEILRNESIPHLTEAVEKKRGSRSDRLGDESIVCLQPVFDKPAIEAWGACDPATGGEAYDNYLSNLTMLPTDRVIVPAPGIGRTLEWWHYQASAARSDGNPEWGSLLEEIGFSRIVLSSPDCPPTRMSDVSNHVYTGGVGYTTKDLDGTSNNTTGGEAENTPPSISGALEAD